MPPVLHKDILDIHAENRADPPERVNHGADQGTIAQPDMCRGVDAGQEFAHLVGGERGGLADTHGMARSGDGKGRIGTNDVAVFEPLQEYADGRKLSFDAWRAELMGHLLDVGGYMQRGDLVEARGCRRSRTRIKSHRSRADTNGACACCGSWPRKIQGSVFWRHRRLSQ
jgi:hypothetical protein